MNPTFSLLHTSARPDAWRAVYDAWRNAAARPEDFEYVLVTDARWGFDVNGGVGIIRSQDKVVCNSGRMCYVDGVNIAAQNANGRVLIVIADDQFPCDRWDAELRERFPVSGAVECVARVNTGTPDERSRNITVMPIVSRARYERLGYLLFPGYESMFSDNDLSEHAQQDGCFVDLADLPVFPHRHAWFDKSVPFDAAYTRQNRPEAYQVGASVLAERRANGFGSKLQMVHSHAKRPENIAICLPGEEFSSIWFGHTLQLICHLLDKYRNVWPVLAMGSNVHMTRGTCVTYMNELPEKPDLVLWIDDDNLLTVEHFEMLAADLAQNADLAGAVGWCWILPDGRPSCGHFDPNGIAKSFDYVKEMLGADQDLVPIEWSGFPTVLHRWSVWEKAGMWPFRPLISDKWTYGQSGEDIAFFENARKGGCQFAVDRRVKVPHLKLGSPEPDWMPKRDLFGAAVEHPQPAVKSADGAQRFLKMARALVGR